MQRLLSELSLRNYWALDSPLLPTVLASHRCRWYSQEEAEVCQGLQGSESGGKGLWSTGSFFINPANQRKGVWKGQSGLEIQQNVTGLMQQPTEMFAYWDRGNCSGKPGSLRGWMWSTCHRKGRATSAIGLSRWWRGLLKSWCETGISINPSPTSLERVDWSVVEHLKSSTWPFHYLQLLQFTKFEHHGVFFPFYSAPDWANTETGCSWRTAGAREADGDRPVSR